MSTSSIAFQKKGGRFLFQVPEAWQEGLCEHAQGEEFLPLAEGLASFLPAAEEGIIREAILLILLMLLAQAEGHTGLPLGFEEGSLLSRLAAEFKADPSELAALAKSDALISLRGGPGSSMPLILDGNTLYAQRLHQAEVHLAQAIRARALRIQTSNSGQEAGLGPDLEPEVRSSLVFDNGGETRKIHELNKEQVQAVRMALQARLTLVTGGPGTGKTSIIVAILREALRRGMDLHRVALAAPTGKAANRMFGSIQEALGALVEMKDVDKPLLTPALSPSTLHRLLSYQPSANKFRQDQDNPLDVDLVIVDESSMVDLILMERLLRAIPPEAKLVLLGDAQQLPSVEAGCVFKDLVDALTKSKVQLEKSFRMDHEEGQAVYQAALKMSKEPPGDLFAEPHPLLPHVQGDDSPKVDYLEGKGREVGTFLLDWFQREVECTSTPDKFLRRIRQVHRENQGVWDPDDVNRLKYLFDHYRQTRILCPLKEVAGLRGATGINEFLHKEASRTRDRGLNRTLAISLGEPVMMTRNDYRRWIFNGDQGLILMVARDGGHPRLEAVFPSPEGGFKAHAISPILPYLELAYAMTVHKSQGSEFDRVVIVLPEQDSEFVTREILYTALTRAKQAVTIVGSEDAIRKASIRTQGRYSELQVRLMN